MKILKYILLLGIVSIFASCSEDSLDSESIFKDEKTTPNALDTWLSDNYTSPFNIRFNYRYVDIESDREYNLVPAEYDKSVALAKIIKYLWLDAYVEVTANADPSFMQTYCPKVIQLIGSAAWNDDGSRILGQAEGGLKITLYEVNAIDLNNINVETMNDLWFHTMHHEFAHILHQNKLYSTDFKLITGSTYNSAGWTDYSNTDAHHLGYITNYASSEPNEDFVELVSMYVTHTEAWWQAMLADAKQAQISASAYASYANGGTKLPDNASLKTVTGQDAEGNDVTLYYLYYGGDEKIKQKFEIVTKYFINSWGFKLSDLRDIVQRRSESLDSLDLTSL
ncbi:MAG TPA: putative zinc-binding metallopeptidase [Bacteroidaceae bacterium]|nr:putative zinc-binding metallopeptidase [Bacteroidaceae bacterium]